MPPRQETLETAVRHMRKQNRKSEDSQGTSKLKNSDGAMCPVGVLIPSERYSPLLEGWPVKEYDTKGNKQPTPLGDLIVELGHDLDLVEALENIHDLKPVSLWEQSFRRLARKFSLTLPKRVS